MKTLRTAILAREVLLGPILLRRPRGTAVLQVQRLGDVPPSVRLPIGAALT